MFGKSLGTSASGAGCFKREAGLPCGRWTKILEGFEQSGQLFLGRVEQGEGNSQRLGEQHDLSVRHGADASFNFRQTLPREIVADQLAAGGQGGLA